MAQHEHAVFLKTRGLLCEAQKQLVGRMRYCAEGLKFGETHRIAGRPTPLLGEHNRDALGALGYGAQEIADLYERGVLTTETPGQEAQR